MALQPYEILLRWNDKGEFSGGHTIRRDDVSGILTTALPIGNDKDHPWPQILGEVNAALASKAGEVDQHIADKKALTKERDDLKARIAAIDPVELAAAAEKRKKQIMDEAAKQVAQIDATFSPLS